VRRRWAPRRGGGGVGIAWGNRVGGSRCHLVAVLTRRYSSLDPLGRSGLDRAAAETRAGGVPSPAAGSQRRESVTWDGAIRGDQHCALRGFGAEVDCPPGSRISPQSHAKVASRDPRRWVRVVCQPYLLQLRSTGAVVHQNVILDRAPDVTDQERQDDGAPGRTGRTQRMSRVLHCAAVIRTLPQTVRSRHSLGRLSDKATCKGWLRPT
jgi:hypothetical protein